MVEEGEGEVVMDVSSVENLVTSLENVPSPEEEEEEELVVVLVATTVSSVEAVDILPEIVPITLSSLSEIVLLLQELDIFIRSCFLFYYSSIIFNQINMMNIE